MHPCAYFVLATHYSSTADPLLTYCSLKLCATAYLKHPLLNVAATGGGGGVLRNEGQTLLGGFRLARSRLPTDENALAGLGGGGEEKGRGGEVSQ